MRVLILETYYPAFLEFAETRFPQFASSSYEEKLALLYETGCCRADAMPHHLQELGHDATQIIVNCEAIQTAWAKERDLGLSLAHDARRRPERIALRMTDKVAAWTRTAPRLRGWKEQVVAAQIEEFRPDVVYCADAYQLTDRLIRFIKQDGRRLVLEYGFPLEPWVDLKPFDLIVSCAGTFVRELQASGFHARLIRHAFDARVLQRFAGPRARRSVVFIGSLTPAHKRRVDLLRALAAEVPIEFYGTGAELLGHGSRATVHPPLWGFDMYARMRDARIVINVHIDGAASSAGNLRLYEATGVGALLFTDAKADLHELFDAGHEVVTYQDPADCLRKISEFLSNEHESDRIAAAGQARTLRDHTYSRRMQQLVESLEELS